MTRAIKPSYKLQYVVKLLHKLTVKKQFKLLDILLSPRNNVTTVGTVTGYNDLTVFKDYTTNEKWNHQDIRVLTFDF